MAEPQHEESYQVGGLVPRPDPSVLTTAQLTRELAWLREVVEGRLATAELDRAWLRSEIEKVPQHINERVDTLHALHEEKFGSIQTQFVERDIRTEQTSRDSKVAVDAALQAAKEAVGAQTIASDRAIAKSEASTAEQIRQLVTLGQTTNQAQSDKIDDLKERLTRIEGRSSGYATAWAAAVAILGVLLAIGSLVFALTR